MGGLIPINQRALAIAKDKMRTGKRSNRPVFLRNAAAAEKTPPRSSGTDVFVAIDAVRNGFGRDIDRDIDRDIGRDIDRDIDRDIGRGIGRGIDRAVELERAGTSAGVDSAPMKKQPGFISGRITTTGTALFLCDDCANEEREYVRTDGIQ